jgi:hypothetical protein
VTKVTKDYAYVDWIEPEGRFRTFQWWYYGRFITYEQYKYRVRMKKTSLNLVRREPGPW